MKFIKLLLAVVAAAVLLGAFVSSTSARNFSASEQTHTTLWRRMDFAGGFGTVECEVKLSGSFHTQTSTKTVNSLIGYITEGTVLRCARGGATINQSSLPWNRRYRGFTGPLPFITRLQETITGVELRIREPTFGVVCTVRREESGSTIGTFFLGVGIVTEAAISSSGGVCQGFSEAHSGSETNVQNRTINGFRITINLI